MAAAWTFADLDQDQLGLVAEAERTLDADIVMVYREGRWSSVDADVVADQGLRVEPLDGSQLEYLQGLERMVGGVAVAYRRTGG